MGITLPEAEITKFEDHNGEIVRSHLNEMSPENPKSPKKFKPDPKTVTELSRYSERDARSRESITRFEEEVAKIPREQDLEFLDPVSLYESKIQMILLLQRNLSSYATKLTKDNVGERDAGKTQDNTFLGIDIHLLTEVLRER